MKIYVAADHNGRNDTEFLVTYLKKSGVAVEHLSGDYDPEDDFPLFAQRVVASILSEDTGSSRGILLCGSGQGMCMAANRYKGIRACLGYDQESVRSARNDDDANVLCLPANHLNETEVCQLADTFIHTPFAAAGRFKRRIAEMDNL